MWSIAAVLLVAGLAACSNQPAAVPRDSTPLPDPDRPFYCMVDLDCLVRELEVAGR